ncbi:outer membrane biosynthesis protein TonB [Paenochrobactrum gallinarii]|uniref:Outer membrane biosynthesis protein TonB n=1 Tax=Paenochrobactrum gallinarii TaxID=643673 RepID=A0A841M532_9HYPH|nr:cell envelope integrity protein TolA [Paenochrobactrum gallinarii]MBB6261268.1 outer membrane biosynthesis protein TonB [Paenochrobactrum gallinarii]
MKAGLTSSVVIHVAIIGMGLVTFSSPRAFDVSDSEAFPVDIVPIESITQVQQGEKTAPKKEFSAPKPTTKPQTVDQAENVGDQDIDLKTPPRPDEKPKNVETADAAKAEPKPADKPEPKPEQKPDPAPETKPEPVPATEVQQKPEPKQDVQPDPVAEAIEKQAEVALDNTPKLPEKVPTPQAKPQPPQAQTAKTPDRKPVEEPKKAANNSASSQEKDATADEVAALLNREKAAGGGAKRSTDQASLGAKKTTGGSKLTQSEMDALRGQISKCWNVPAGVADAQGLVVTVKMRLTESGEIDGAPVVTSGGAESGVGRVAAESAKRAVMRCAPYNLPRDKYDSWSDVIVNFDPSEMF